MVPGRKEMKRVSPAVRSMSLPCQSHPVVSKLEWEILAAGDVVRSAGAGRLASAAWLRSAFTQLERLNLAAGNVLLLPSTREMLRSPCSSSLSESLLDDLLCYADAHGSLRMALASIQDIGLEAKAALRRGDGTRLRGVARALRRAQKEIDSLVRILPGPPAAAGDTGEVSTILGEVMSATLLVSTSVFHAVSAAVSTAAVAAQPKSTSSWGRWRRWLRSTPQCSASISEDWCRRASEGLKEMEDRLLGLEKAAEQVYRVLISARVSLLNVLTPS